ncbi:hypothetical protein [Azonexus sp.]|uniref:hypothetical protein n=1 Tax=Azonexus sp. TaxID=1872668 RepID=UPI0035AD8F56
MTALTQDRNTAHRVGDQISAGVAAAVKCFAGGIAVLDAAGNLKPGVAAAGLICVGRFEETVDNSAGLAGDLTATARRGVFRYANSAAGDAITAAEIGDVCYIVDDQTVAKTSNGNARSIAGVIDDVDSAGVWVRMGFETNGELLAANNLSDLVSKPSARANLGGGADKVVLPMGSVSLVGAGAAVLRTVAPVAGTLDAIRSVLNGALTTGDATLTAKIGAAAVTNGVVTITQAASAAGDVDSAAPTAAKTVAPGDVISVTVGGTNDANVTANVVLTLTPSA